MNVPLKLGLAFSSGEYHARTRMLFTPQGV
jgi:hypothetical protein